MVQKEKNNTEACRLNELRDQLKVAVKTLKHQPYQKGDKPHGIISSWPIHSGKNNFASYTIYKKYTMKSTPKQITHMQYWMDKMLSLDEESRRIVMARAAGMSWRKLEEVDGRSHTTLRKIEKCALNALLQGLDHGRTILPRDFIA